MIQEVPQSFVLGLILFNVYLNICDVNLESVPEKLVENSEFAVTWFEKKLHETEC